MSRLNQQIALARKLVAEGLHQDNLSKLIRLCSELSQDSPHSLLFFVLKNIFRETDGKLDSQGNTPEMFETLTKGIAEGTDRILRQLEETGDVSSEAIEDLVRTHLRNHGVFGAEQ